MGSTPLTDRIHAVVATGRTRLPAYPPVARQLLLHLQQPLPDVATLAALVSQDPALTCGLFRAANSAFYQGLPKVRTVTEATTRLGMPGTAELLEELCRDSAATGYGRLVPRYLPRLWRHALGCALGADWLARRCGYHALAGEGYLAGLLHDIGELYLLAILEQLASDDEETGTLGDTLVGEVLASMHGGMGVQLLQAWNLPDGLAEVVDGHHDPEAHGQDVVMALVRLADQACRKLGLGGAHTPDLVLPTTAEAQFLGISEIALAELEIMLEDRFRLANPAAGPSA